MAYGVLPLIRELRGTHPHVTHPWYADDVVAGGNSEKILTHFRDLQAWGPTQGYFPEPTKSILVVALRNVARAEEFFRGMGITVVTGSHKLGGFIIDREAEDTWLAEKVKGWVELMKKLLGVACKHPQSAYA